MNQSFPGREEIELAALFNTIMYFLDGGDIDDQTLRSVIESVDEKEVSQSEKKDYEILKQKLDIIGDYRITQTSWNMAVPKLNTGTVAAVFSDKKKVFIAYRGTSDGEWADNRYCYLGKDSPQQREALRYFDEVAKNFDNGRGLKDKDVIITGHSKGGNDAQYVTLCTKYGERIRQCISMDGPGFSPEQVKAWEAKFGQKTYEQKRKKLYAVNGENDYINEQGHIVIPKENIAYIATPDAKHIADYHEISFFFDANGNVRQFNKDAQGALGAYAARLSQQIQHLPEKRRSHCAMLILCLCEYYMGKPKNEYRRIGLNGEKVSIKDILGFLLYGIPTIVGTLFTKEGK